MSVEPLQPEHELPATGWWQPDGGERVAREMIWKRKDDGSYYFHGRDAEGIIFIVPFIEKYPDNTFLLRLYCFPGQRYEMLGQTDGEGNLWGRWTQDDEAGDWHIHIEGGVPRQFCQAVVVKVADISDSLDDIQQLGKRHGKMDL